MTFKQGLYARTPNYVKGLAGSVHSLWFHIIALQLIKLLSLKEYIRIPLEKKATYFEKKGYVVS